MRECTKCEPCWLHGALHRRLTLRPAKTIGSGSGSPGDFPISESRTCEQNKCVFFTGQSPNLTQKMRPTPQRGQPTASEAPPTVPSTTPRSPSTTRTLMASLQPAVPRATGLPSAYGARHKRPSKARQTTHLIYATARARTMPTTAPARTLGLSSRTAPLVSCRPGVSSA